MSAQSQTPEQRRALYRQMLLIRRFEERALELRAADEIDGVVHPYIGQEAVAVGVCATLGTRDRITSTHRGHGHCIAKGADPRRMMAELFGRVDGYCKGKGGSMHIADFEIGMLGANGIVGAGLPIAAGAALAAAMEGDGAIAVCFFSDGATNEGEFHECLNMSALWKLPIVWLCENNGVASGTPAEEGLAGDGPAALASGYGIATDVVDGNDVEAVFQAAGRAAEQARAGRGPAFLEARTFRMLGHAYRTVAPPDSRDASLLKEWQERDPIDRFGAVLVADGVLDEAALRAIGQSVADEIEEAVRFAQASPQPRLEDALEDFFATGAPA
jgi:TPP-dependent pyruvate/acetoin dehydrogenase alpha subunit